MAGLDWTTELDLQLSWHWETNLWPRWAGLADDEYRWEPVGDCWNVRRRGETRSANPAGSGPTVLDFAWPEPDPPPVTTIAWRMAHLQVGVFGDRNARYFAGPATSWDEYDYPLSAATALDRLDAGYRTWIAGVRRLGPAELAERCREPGFESSSMAAMILHVHRELLHHGAEICLLRDLYTRLRRPSG